MRNHALLFLVSWVISEQIVALSERHLLNSELSTRRQALDLASRARDESGEPCDDADASLYSSIFAHTDRVCGHGRRFSVGGRRRIGAVYRLDRDFCRRVLPIRWAC